MSNRTTNQVSASTEPFEIVCEDFQQHSSKKTLIGYCTLAFPAIGLRIFDCAFHVADDRRAWVTFPGNFTNGKWVPSLEAFDFTTYLRVQSAAIKSIRKFLDGLQTPLTRPQPKAPGPPKAEIPI
jgi:hypothetical protein